MPRTLDAALLAAMNAGGFTPYFNVQLLAANRSTVVFQTTEVTGFTLDGLTAKVSFHDDLYVNSYATFRIQRGIMIAGVPNIITSSQFYPTLDRYTKRIRSLEGHVFPISFYSSSGDVSYGSIIATICAAYGLSVAYDDGGADWISYQFYPTGRTFTLNDARQFFTILRQKYLVFATDNCNDQLFFFQAKAVGPAYPAGYAPVYPGLAAIPGLGSYKLKSFLSRDELSTTHTTGDPGSPLHNLGFLPSTAVHPDCYWYTDSPDWFVTDISPNLKYRDFDALKVVFDNSVLALWPARFREIFDKKLHPSWQLNCKYLDIFANTEGGSIPSTIEAAAPYTPINVTNFDKNLNSTVNNLQALADRVDELDTGPSIAAATALNPPDDADLFPVVDMSLMTPKVKNITWLQIKTDLNDQSLRSTLSADRHYHVRVDGNDANTGLTDSAGGAFLTIQHAVDVVAGLDTAIYNVAIQVSDGTYNANSVLTLKNPVGAGTVTISGNLTTPDNVVIGSQFSKDVSGSIYILQGFKITLATGQFIFATNGAVIKFSKINFGAGCTYAHLLATNGGRIVIVGAYTISASVPYHMSLYAQGNITMQYGTYVVTVSGTPGFSQFVACSSGSTIFFWNVLSFSGAATGQRFFVDMNGVVNAGGGANYFPGNSAGATATGGQYA